MKVHEKILFVIAIIALSFMFTPLPGGAWLFMLSVSTLSMLYFPLGFLLLSGVGLRQAFKGGLKNVSSATIITAILVGLALATLSCGILFRLLHLSGALELLLIGLVLGVVMTVLVLLQYLKSKSTQGLNLMTRLIVFSALGLTLYLTSSRALLSLQYRNHPAYVNAYLQYMENPNAETAKAKDIEYARMILPPQEFERLHKDK